MTAAEKGSALHLAMRHMDLSAELSEKGIREQLAMMVERGLLSPVQADSIDVETVAVFFRGSLGQRLINSSRVLREVHFTLAIPAQELYPQLKPPDTGNLVVQGALDCLFWESEGWVLVDYKSDMITRETVPHFIERYRIQLEIYSRAVETIYKEPVCEKLLYSFQLGEAFSV